MGAAERSPVWMSFGRWCPPEIDPSFRMPLRTPFKKSRSGEAGGSSSLFESDGVENLDSKEPSSPEVSSSGMIAHDGGEEGEGEGEEVYHHLKASPAPAAHMGSLLLILSRAGGGIGRTWKSRP